ncbi:hypothetical protein MIR68_009400 [Amoeboaphelidium protococcarum]|nr:hypothetical protein MIR68_009400 [Amoeboaphelidium protococcarum]
MGGLLTKLRKPAEDDYEKILAGLDEDIQKLEVRISESNVNQRKFMAVLTTYGLIIYLCWLLSFFLFQWRTLKLQNGVAQYAVSVSPVVLAPLLLLVSRWMVQAYFRRSITLKEQELDSCKKSQKLKVEEMKKKLNYYVAKNLIDRYEHNRRTPMKDSQTAVSAGRPRGNSLKSQQHSQQNQIRSQQPSQQQQQQQQLQQGALRQPSFSQQQQKSVNGGGLQMSPPDIPPQQYQPQDQLRLNMSPPKIMPHPSMVSSSERTWMDRILDVIIGEDGPQDKFALICEKCFTHNGLVPPNEYNLVQYTCAKCGHFNNKRDRFSIPSPSPNRVSSPPAVDRDLSGSLAFGSRKGSSQMSNSHADSDKDDFQQLDNEQFMSKSNEVSDSVEQRLLEDNGSDRETMSTSADSGKEKLSKRKQSGRKKSSSDKKSSNDDK